MHLSLLILLAFVHWRAFTEQAVISARNSAPSVQNLLDLTASQDEDDMEYSGEEEFGSGGEQDQELEHMKDILLTTSMLSENQRLVEKVLLNRRAERHSIENHNDDDDEHDQYDDDDEESNTASNDDEMHLVITDEVDLEGTENSDIESHTNVNMTTANEPQKQHTPSPNDPARSDIDQTEGRRRRHLPGTDGKHLYLSGGWTHDQCPEPARVYSLKTVTVVVPQTVYHTQVLPLTRTELLTMKQTTTVTLVSTAHITVPYTMEGPRTPTLPLTVYTTHVLPASQISTITSQVKLDHAVTSRLTSTHIELATEYRKVFWTSTVLVPQTLTRTEHVHIEEPTPQTHTVTTTIRVSVPVYTTHVQHVTRDVYITKEQPPVYVTEYRQRYVTISTHWSTVTVTTHCV